MCRRFSFRLSFSSLQILGNFKTMHVEKYRIKNLNAHQ